MLVIGETKVRNRRTEKEGVYMGVRDSGDQKMILVKYSVSTIPVNAENVTVYDGSEDVPITLILYPPVVCQTCGILLSENDPSDTMCQDCADEIGDMSHNEAVSDRQMMLPDIRDMSHNVARICGGCADSRYRAWLPNKCSGCFSEAVATPIMWSDGRPVIWLMNPKSPAPGVRYADG